jgi:phosphohistidine phosphatase
MKNETAVRRLIIMRHGEAGSATRGGAGGDYDRPLTQAGAVNVSRMAAWLDQQEWRPAVILCSPARRTRETARLVIEGLSLPDGSVHSDPRLYLADEHTILTVLAEQAADRGTLMLVGHNPALASLIARFTGRHPAVPPATVALLEAHTPDWQLSGQILRTHAVRQPGLD